MLSLLCASGFVHRSHMCHIYLRRYLCPRQCFLALGGSVRPWWGTGIVLTKVLKKGKSTGEIGLRPPNATPSGADPTGTQPLERTLFFTNCISYSWSRDANPKGECSLVSIASLVQAGGMGKCLLSVWDNLLVLWSLRRERWQKHQSERGGREKPIINFCLLKLFFSFKGEKCRSFIDLAPASEKGKTIQSRFLPILQIASVLFLVILQCQGKHYYLSTQGPTCHPDYIQPGGTNAKGLRQLFTQFMHFSDAFSLHSPDFFF